MSWYKVTIDASPSPAARREVLLDLEETFNSRLKNATRDKIVNAVLACAASPADQNTPTPQVYYFSPEASVLMRDVIKEKGGVPCSDPTSMKDVRCVAGNRGKYVFASDSEV